MNPIFISCRVMEPWKWRHSFISHIGTMQNNILSLFLHFPWHFAFSFLSGKMFILEQKWHVFAHFWQPIVIVCYSTTPFLPHFLAQKAEFVQFLVAIFEKFSSFWQVLSPSKKCRNLTSVQSFIWNDPRVWALWPCYFIWNYGVIWAKLRCNLNGMTL